MTCKRYQSANCDLTDASQFSLIDGNYVIIEDEKNNGQERDF
jgi:hypothetical protein